MKSWKYAAPRPHASTGCPATAKGLATPAVVVLAVLGGIIVPAATASAQATIAADRFVDSVGINLHLHHDGALYRDDFPLIKSRLLELGVRHVRDGLIDTAWQGYYDRHNELGAAGIKGIFIVSPGMSDTLLQHYPSRVAAAFEGYEAPNEYNWSGDAAWAATLRATLVQLRALKNIPAIAHFPIIGPSLTDRAAYATLGDVSALVDTGNLHNYFAGRHPGTGGWGANGYGSIDWNLANVRPYVGNKPIVTTETGYWDDLALTDAAPPDVVAKYMPRLLLEQYRKGIARTYIYELVDYQEARLALWSGYGLLRRDGVRKPAFLAVSGLLTLLADPGPSITVRPVSYSVNGGGADVRHLLFQKRDGRYFLAIWIEQSGYNVNTRAHIAVPEQTVTIVMPDSVRAAAAHRWQADGRVVRTAMAATSTTPLTISDRLTVVELSGPTSVPSSPANPRVLPSY